MAKDTLKIGKGKVVKPPRQVGKGVFFTVATYYKNKDGSFASTFVDCMAFGDELIKRSISYATPKAWVSVFGGFKGIETYVGKDGKTYITAKLFLENIGHVEDTNYDLSNKTEETNQETITFPPVDESALPLPIDDISF